VAGYLLDTHTAIWFFNGDDKLSRTAAQVISDRSNLLFMSIASDDNIVLYEVPQIW